MQEENTGISKEPWLAVLLSRLVGGIGQIYAGRILRGCIILFIQLALSAIVVWLFFSPTGNLKIGVAFGLIGLAFCIWNLFDAHKCARSVNSPDFETSRKQNKDPWLAVFLSSLIPGLGQLYIRKWLWGSGFILCLLLIPNLSKHPKLSIGLSAVLSAIVCYHAYATSPVRRELSKRIIMIVAALIFSLGLWQYAALPFRTHVAEAFKMTDSYMEPTLLDGDRMIVWKFGEYNPKRGDVVLFKVHIDPYLPFAGRVTALEGDSVEIGGNSIRINGQELDLPLLQDANDLPAKELIAKRLPFIVPENHLFLMRDKARKDIRSLPFGPIPVADIYGRAYKIYWPPQRMGIIE